MTTYHISKNGEPGICKAEKDACPLGGEHGTKEQIQAESEKRFAEKFKHIPTTTNYPEELRETKAGIERFEGYKKQWLDVVAKSRDAYIKRHSENTRLNAIVLNDVALSDTMEKETLAARSRKGNFDGAWIQPNADGSMNIPAGDYVYISTDGWRKDSSYEEDRTKTNSLDKWQNQVYQDTPPGAVGGAYLDGKPSYFLSAWSMGQNHGYDGEMLLSKYTYDKLIKEDKIDVSLYPVTDVKVEKDTKMYGYLGNPALAPKGLYTWEDYNEEPTETSPEAEDIFGGDASAAGSFFENKTLKFTDR